LGIMICLESVYPQDAAEFVDAGADLLITSTDDSGFQRSPIAEFHVRRAAIRSIETGRWGAHVSQAGPSAMTDPHGRTVARLGFWEQGLIVGNLRLGGLSTPYQTAGDVFSWVLLAVIAALVRSSAGSANRRAPQNNAT
jgi:apolipoprotein N-acyltransferase